MEEKYKVELSKREVESLGENRWIRSNKKWFVYLIIPMALLLISVAALPDDSLAQSIIVWLSVVVVVIVFGAWTIKFTKKGKSFYEQVKRSALEQNT